MNYILIIISTALFSMQFLFNSKFREECGSGWQASVDFSILSAISGFILLMVINGFSLKFTPFSLMAATVYAVAGILFNFFGIKALNTANLSLYSIFTMLGGMSLPFVYGIGFMNEELSVAKIICFLLIAASLFFTVEKGKSKKGAIKYYIGIFVMNGLFGVISAFHQSYPDINVDSESFLAISRIVTIVICVAIKLIQREKLCKINGKVVLYSGGGAAVNTIGNLFLLIALTNNLPASVQYPIVTGGTIVFSTLISIVRKEHPSKREIIAAVIAFFAATAMAF